MENKKSAITVILFAMIMITSVFAMMPTALADPLSTADLSTGLTPTDLVNNLLGSGVSVSNVVSQNVAHSMGTFSGGTGIIGFESGIILSTGDIVDVVGPNTEDGTTTNNSLPGDSDL